MCIYTYIHIYICTRLLMKCYLNATFEVAGLRWSHDKLFLTRWPSNHICQVMWPRRVGLGVILKLQVGNRKCTKIARLFLFRLEIVCLKSGWISVNISYILQFHYGRCMKAAQAHKKFVLFTIGMRYRKKRPDVSVIFILELLTWKVLLVVVDQLRK